jgi:hypothetical protein
MATSSTSPMILFHLPHLLNSAPVLAISEIGHFVDLRV